MVSPPRAHHGPIIGPLTLAQHVSDPHCNEVAHRSSEKSFVMDSNIEFRCSGDSPATFYYE